MKSKCHVFCRTDFTKVQDGSGNTFFDELLQDTFDIPKEKADTIDSITVYFDSITPYILD